ncbi:aminopeptidase [Vibrio splendidus ZS-139]|nr:aminopeptidase [Vibrio splendidus ZS-139]
MIGQDIHNLARKLWKINRSLTGEGVRETLSIISQELPSLETKSYDSGSKVFDWTIPDEWEIKEAYIIDPLGNKICDFYVNNLHLVGYSTPINQKMSLTELQNHLYSLPDQPDAIPYITSYYKERWGFCISHNARENLIDGEYHVVIDSRHFKGVLNYGELLIKGQSEKEVFISTYICHPSMANNELSGPTVVTYLAKWLLEQEKLKYSYRIVFIPETIGSISYLSQHYKFLKENVYAGFNVTCVGDNRAYSYLPSRAGDTISDDIAKHVLKWKAPDYISYTWNDRGSDERQYCAPGIDLPIATMMRTKYGEYPEYHTSLDDLKTVVTPEGLQGGYDSLKYALEALEMNVTPKVKILCEPQLGKRGLYPTLSTKGADVQVRLMMNFISYCDGDNSLLDIADKVNVPIWDLYHLLLTLRNEDIIYF